MSVKMNSLAESDYGFIKQKGNDLVPAPIRLG